MEAGSNLSRSSSDEFTRHLLQSTLTSASCCVFFIINGTILFLLHSKPLFSRCPRYVLLFNLVLADTVLIAQAQVLFLLVIFKVWVLFPLCMSLAMVAHLTDQISPITLIFMSLERCVAVCFPFRHCTLVTLRNTYAATSLVWAVALLNAITQLLLLQDLPDSRRPVLCRMMTLPVGPRFQAYEAVSTYLLFVLSALVISGSFVAVMVVACLASGDRKQAVTTRNTLLLHLFQLSLNLVSVMNMELFMLVLRCCGRWLLDPIYVCVVLMPRCLSTLTYGLRDPALRPALRSSLCCALRVQLQAFRHKRRRSLSTRLVRCLESHQRSTVK